MKSRWQINKLGLVNFWYYDIEEFELQNGKLLLRGSNGSGKSVTMQSFIPLLLDGNKSPERLDPFGTRARTIANYLLDENTDEKTAYLYIEFKRKDSENYLTIGMGLKALKGKTPQSWYFILSDGRRINKDLFLYRDAGEKVPLTKKQLENTLGEGNFFTESQGKYMAKVNELLFGFNDIDSYEELLNLLISIRSPKLSKDFKPTEIYKILTNSLKVLSEEDLRPMSESMENMDAYKNTLEDNIRSLESANKIRLAYDRYNRYILNEKAERLVDENNELEAVKKEIASIEAKIKAAEKEALEKKEELNVLENDLRMAEDSYERLQDREEVRLQKELSEVKIRIADVEQNKIKKEESLNLKKDKERELEYSIKREKDELELQKDKLKDVLSEMDDLAEEGYFMEGKDISKDILNDIKNSDLSLLDPALKEYILRLKSSKSALEFLESKNKEKEQLTEKEDNKNAELQHKIMDIKRAEELLYTEKENYKVKYVAFNKNNTIFNLSEEKIKEIINEIDVSEDEKDINRIRALNLRNEGEIKNHLNGKKTIEENKILELQNKIEELRVGIQELKTAKEIEPERRAGVIKNRNRLKEEKIPYVPLYKAIDFNKDVSDELKDNIESSLNEMGLLDALCIDKTYMRRAIDLQGDNEDKYIFPEPNFMRYNISNYLKVNRDELNDVSYETVDNVLQGIFLEDNTLTYLDEKGIFGIGILVGKSDRSYKAKYIGEGARKKLREELINEKIKNTEKIQGEIDISKSKIAIIDKEIEMLEQEYKNIPELHDISEGFYLVKSIENDIKYLEEEKEKISSELYKVKEALNKSKTKVYELVQKLEVKTLGNVTDALESMEDYREIFIQCREKINLIKSKISIVEIQEKSMEDVRYDLDEIYYELNKINLSINKDEVRVKSIEEVLSKSSLNEIKLEIEKCLAIKTNYPSKINKKRKTIDKIEIYTENDKQSKYDLIEKRDKFNGKVEILKAILNEEEALELLGPKKEGNIISRAKEIINEDSIKNKGREDFTTQLFESFNRNSGELRDFTPKIVDILNDDEQDEYSNIRRRKEIKCRIQGKEISFLFLIEEISKSIEEQKLLISEQERNIFQEILVNTISQKINAKILQSRKWIKEVNKLMETMDTSSSLKLSLTWQPKKADSEGLLDISEITDIFERKNLCTEEEFRALGDHFTQKVQETLRKYEGSGEFRNYHSVIKEVLDYRQWYEFKLHFTKKGEKKRELTNNAFFQFSGGEKAMSMYIPLFAAVYARYKNANEDCPKVITMDEAFAGVDENNIRDMFRLLNVLDLDYILNSQVLWGDYDTVKSLAIAELIREENDDVVTVLRYIWNGKEKVLLQ